MLIDIEKWKEATPEVKMKFCKEADRLVTHNGYTKADFLLMVKFLLGLAEQKEPCEYCGPKTSKFDTIFISDIEHDCKWCKKEECDNYEDSCYGIGYGIVPLKYCPNCGRPINQPQEDTNE